VTPEKGELATGVVRGQDEDGLVVDLEGGVEGRLPAAEQVPREEHRPGDRIIAWVMETSPRVLLSRAHRGLVEKLFEMEVPEIFDRVVRIEASAREPGVRAKIAVSTERPGLDPVQACLGARRQAVVDELRGEVVDVVAYDRDPMRFVCAAIAPVEVTRVVLDLPERTVTLIVPEDQLRLAIGVRGCNIRLASQLTGWRIEIMRRLLS
jgi:N utilization substance protein A